MYRVHTHIDIPYIATGSSCQWASQVINSFHVYNLAREIIHFTYRQHKCNSVYDHSPASQ